MNRHSAMLEFTKKDLLAIADEAGLELPDTTQSVKILDAIIHSLDTEGVFRPDECSELMYKFLVASGIFDVDGNITNANAFDTPSEDVVIVIPNDDNPPCMSWADARDPACRKCKHFDVCLRERVAKRPACFGKEFDRREQDCRECIDNADCRKVFEKSK